MVQAEIVGQVGEQRLAQGVNGIVRQGPLAEVMISELRGRYSEQNYNNRMFIAALQNIQALSAYNTQTYTGLCLVNPANSQVVLELDEIVTVPASAPSGLAAIALGYNTALPTTYTTQLTTQPAKLSTTGSSGAKATAWSAVTLAANPTIIRPIACDLASGSTVTMAALKDDVGGAILLEPGTCIESVYWTTAISVLQSFTWTELPLSLFMG
jgi:hypothetical protein